jgi:nucleotide-binding universal stress UspA family protein
MAYTSLATFVTSEAEMDQVLPAAIEFARRRDAHLTTYTLGVDMVPAGGFYMGASPLVLTEALGRAQETAEELAARARARLQGETLRWGVEPAIAPFGGLPSLVGQRARFTDLVIQARPYGRGALPAQEAVLEAALFEGQAAVLTVPDTGLGRNLGRRVVVAWNQSNEALATVRRALPLLRDADKVSVVIVDPPVQSAERSDPGGMMTQWLSRHGVRAEVVVLAKTLPRVSDVLMRYMTDSDSDLLVMGAYGHSRLREAILGGATRNLLENADFPVFLAH